MSIGVKDDGVLLVKDDGVLLIVNPTYVIKKNLNIFYSKNCNEKCNAKMNIDHGVFENAVFFRFALYFCIPFWK